MSESIISPRRARKKAFSDDLSEIRTFFRLRSVRARPDGLSGGNLRDFFFRPLNRFAFCRILIYNITDTNELSYIKSV